MGGTNKPFFEKMKVYFFGVVFGFTTLPHDWFLLDILQEMPSFSEFLPHVSTHRNMNNSWKMAQSKKTAS